MLEIKELTKRYGDFTALDKVSVRLDRGIYGLLGSNGAGKSTFMQLLTDNLKRTSGEILYNGKDILTLGKKYRENVGYMPQVQGMYEDFKARDFLHYIGRLKGIGRKKIREETEELLKVVGLINKAHKKLGSYSGGMRQRVLLAAALLGNPEILILDEPTAGLDVEERIRLCSYISELSKERTVILATHIVSDIEAVADCILLLSRGKIEISGKPHEVADSIKGKIFDFYGNYESVLEKMKEYPKGRLIKTGEGLRLRISANEALEGFVLSEDLPTLEDVYLYYSEGRL